MIGHLTLRGVACGAGLALGAATASQIKTSAKSTPGSLCWHPVRRRAATIFRFVNRPCGSRQGVYGRARMPELMTARWVIGRLVCRSGRRYTLNEALVWHTSGQSTTRLMPSTAWLNPLGRAKWFFSNVFAFSADNYVRLVWRYVRIWNFLSNLKTVLRHLKIIMLPHTPWYEFLGSELNENFLRYGSWKCSFMQFAVRISLLY